jgi:hypothetical protein
MEKQNVRIEHRIANGGAKGNDQEKLGKRQLGNGAATDPSDQKQGIKVYENGPEGDLDQDERLLVA